MNGKQNYGVLIREKWQVAKLYDGSVEVPCYTCLV